MKKSHLHGAFCATVFLVISLSSQAALVGVLPATSSGTDWQAVYDNDGDISWTANTNLAASNTFGVTGIDPAGWMTWAKANEWIGAMNTASYLGFNDWRLPVTQQPDATCDLQTDDVPPQGFFSGCTGSEMGHLSNVEGVTSAAPGLFSNNNLGQGRYWSGTEFAPSTFSAWTFNFATGKQFTSVKTTPTFALAVRSGNVSAVPVPAAVWLFGSGLIGLLGLAHRQR